MLLGWFYHARPEGLQGAAQSITNDCQGELLSILLKPKPESSLQTSTD